MGEVIRHPRFQWVPANEHWLTKSELADHLGVSTRTVDRWVSQDGMPDRDCWRYVGSHRRYLASRVLEWLDAPA